MALRDLRTDVDVEEAHVFAQLPRPLADGLLDIGSGHGFGDDQGDVLLGERLSADVRGRGRVCRVRDKRIEIKLHGARARGHVEGSNHARMQLPRMTHHLIATTTFLEKITVQLPEAFMKAMGKAKPDIDFHDVMYKGLMKFKGTAVWEKYDLASFEARYSAALKASGDGVLDSALNQNLQREIQAMLDGIAATDAAVLAKVFGR